MNKEHLAVQTNWLRWESAIRRDFSSLVSCASSATLCFNLKATGKEERERMFFRGYDFFLVTLSSN